MNDDYLWDRSGPPDPEVQRLERLLARYRGSGTAPALPPRRRRTRVMLAAAASLLIFVAAAALVFSLRFRWPADEPWHIVSVTGTPTIDGRPIDSGARLAVGEVLRTDSRSSVTVQVARIGAMDIGPDSQVTLVVTARRHRVRLDRGTIYARVWAPPFTFAVRTPAGQAADLGCAFALRYEEGAGEVLVTSGWVDFDGPARSAVIPGGAMAELREEHGPGTPFYADAPELFRAALRELDFRGDRGALEVVIRHARPKDAMTLLHLLERSRGYPEWRGPLFDRLAELAPPPPGVTREGILAYDRRMLSAWRDSLGLGGVKRWWVNWRDALPR